MIETIYFPAYNGQRYYQIHYKFIWEFLHHVGLNIEKKHFDGGGASFPIEFKERKILFDYSDHPGIAENADQFDATFKFHYSREYGHDKIKNLYPFSPVSFYDWDGYYDLSREIRYTAMGEKILNSQNPYAGAMSRRRKVQGILAKRYGDQFDRRVTEQTAFWRKINGSLISVCVPGARNDMLDRGQLQYMAFAACTISPRLNIELAFNRTFDPDVHYVACADDYSDVVEKVEWVRANRKLAVEIGLRAREVFRNFLLPQALWKWMNICLKN